MRLIVAGVGKTFNFETGQSTVTLIVESDTTGLSLAIPIGEEYAGRLTRLVSDPSPELAPSEHVLEKTREVDPQGQAVPPEDDFPQV